MSSISTVLTFGLGSFSDENLLLTLGFGAGVATPPVEPPVTEETPSQGNGAGSRGRYYTSQSKGELQKFVKNRVKAKEKKQKRYEKPKIPQEIEVKPEVIDYAAIEAIEAQKLRDAQVIQAVYAKNLEEAKIEIMSKIAAMIEQEAQEQEEIELLLMINDL